MHITCILINPLRFPLGSYRKAREKKPKFHIPRDSPTLISVLPALISNRNSIFVGGGGLTEFTISENRRHNDLTFLLLSKFEFTRYAKTTTALNCFLSFSSSSQIINPRMSIIAISL